MSVATLTAFAVAPLTEQPLPPSLRVVHPVPVLPQPSASEDMFLRQAVIARGESLGSLFRKLGEQDREAGTVSFRFRDGTQENGVPVADATARIRQAIASHALVLKAEDSTPRRQ